MENLVVVPLKFLLIILDVLAVVVIACNCMFLYTYKTMCKYINVYRMSSVEAHSVKNSKRNTWHFVGTNTLSSNSQRIIVLNYLFMQII